MSVPISSHYSKVCSFRNNMPGYKMPRYSLGKLWTCEKLSYWEHLIINLIFLDGNFIIVLVLYHRMITFRALCDQRKSGAFCEGCAVHLFFARLPFPKLEIDCVSGKGMKSAMISLHINTYISPGILKTAGFNTSPKRRQFWWMKPVCVRNRNMHLN